MCGESKEVVAHSKLTGYEVRNSNWSTSPGIEEIDELIEFDTAQTVEQLITWEKNRLAHIKAKMEELTPQYEALNEEYLKKLEAVTQEEAKKEEQEKAERKAREERLQKEKEALEQSKIDWITTHGSQYLKDCLALGYECQRLDPLNLEKTLVIQNLT